MTRGSGRLLIGTSFGTSFEVGFAVTAFAMDPLAFAFEGFGTGGAAAFGAFEVGAMKTFGFGIAAFGGTGGPAARGLGAIKAFETISEEIPTTGPGPGTFGGGGTLIFGTAGGIGT